MTPQITPEDFVEQWRFYLMALEGEATRALARRKHAAFRNHLAPLLNDVFVRLLSDDALDAVREAVRDELTDEDSVEAIELLCRELRFYTEWRGLSQQRATESRVEEYAVAGDYGDVLPDDAPVDDGADEEGDDAVGAGKTIKDSAEELIKKLPKWLRRLLQVLNELLSIVRGGG